MSQEWPPEEYPSQPAAQQWRPERYDPNEHFAHARRQQEFRGQQPPPLFQPGYQGQPSGHYPPPYQPGPRRSRRRKNGTGRVVAIIIGSAVLLIILVVALSSNGSQSPAPAVATSAPGVTFPADQPTSASATAAPSTVTYVVTGSRANVTYGPAGSDATGSVPMRKTVTIPASAPLYYAIDAQLNGSGSVTCEILVGSRVISRATASGGYQIASCEIVPDPLTGNWQDANTA
ncbi:MAG TPA: hypothetical protein VMU95_38060 [Trebonia sp.]|nr:hypothetical protein [Trebonia sp.]